MKQTVGGVAVGDRFFDREPDLSLFMQRIGEGAHILLAAQRRMGKTSLMREAERRLRERYVCLFVDLQDAFTAPDAIVALSLAIRPYKPLWKKTYAVFANVLGKVKDAVGEISLGELSVKLRSGVEPGDWSQKGDELLAILSSAEKPVLLLLDEVPILVNRMLKGGDFKMTPERRRDVDEFMSWLRKNSLVHQGKIRMVVSGSIGLEPVLHQAHLSATLNTFEPFDLKPWDEATAISCLDALAAGYGLRFRDDAQVAMVRRLGCCIPEHVQMFFSHVQARCARGKRTEVSQRDVEKVYQDEMLGVRAHAELTHYEERLKLVLGPTLLPLALEMLSEAAVSGRLQTEALTAMQRDYPFEDCSTADAQAEILRVLEHDGYLRLVGKKYVFVSSLVRDWWKKRHGMFYTAVLEREGRR